MTLGFSKAVERFLAEFMSSNGFSIDDFKELGAEGKSAVFVKSADRKLCIYLSQRDGEINCMIGSTKANNDEIGSGIGWSYVNSVLNRRRSLSIEELLATIPNTPRGYEDQLKEIASNLNIHINELVPLVRA
jgi:hypothetical protein